MSEHPILFSGLMVRAILDGRKTQTRRVVKHQPPEAMPASMIRVGPYNPVVENRWGEQEAGPEVFGAYDTEGEWGVVCPYGQPGDTLLRQGSFLWVRETWASSVGVDYLAPSAFNRCDGTGAGDGWPYWYAADDAVRWTGATSGGPAFTTRGKWRPSIHMPRWASRLTLRVTDVRVERLQAISEADALAEGVAPLCGCGAAVDGGICVASKTTPEFLNAREAFRTLWDSINGERSGCSWAENPWVWVVGFEVRRG